MYLHPTRTNEIPARAQLHMSVDRQTAAQMQNMSSMYTEQQSHFPRMRAGYSTVGGICTEWHGWICLEDKGESVRATDGSGQSKHVCPSQETNRQSDALRPKFRRLTF
jgi:hypothetical protein